MSIQQLNFLVVSILKMLEQIQSTRLTFSAMFNKIKNEVGKIKKNNGSVHNLRSHIGLKGKSYLGFFQWNMMCINYNAYFHHIVTDIFILKLLLFPLLLYPCLFGLKKTSDLTGNTRTTQTFGWLRQGVNIGHLCIYAIASD